MFYLPFESSHLSPLLSPFPHFLCPHFILPVILHLLFFFLPLQKFPDEGLANVVRNVFDFDSYNKDMREVLIEALHKHGIPIGAKPSAVHLAKE